MTPKKLLSSIKIIVIALILAVGIQYIYAQTNTWISAPGAPTNCPTGDPGCDAPINVSSTAQDKLGSLTVNGSTVAQNPVGLYSWGQSVFDNTGGSAVSAIRIIDGNQNTGKVLTSDVNGNGTWQTPSTSGSVDNFGGIYMTGWDYYSGSGKGTQTALCLEGNPLQGNTCACPTGYSGSLMWNWNVKDGSYYNSHPTENGEVAMVECTPS
jgi:hypothetical protein